VEEQNLELSSSMYSRPTLRGKTGTPAVNMAAESMLAEHMAAEDIPAEGMAAEGMLAESMAAESTRMRNCDFVDISVGQRGSSLDKTEQH